MSEVIFYKAYVNIAPRRKLREKLIYIQNSQTLKFTFQSLDILKNQVELLELGEVEVMVEEYTRNFVGSDELGSGFRVFPLKDAKVDYSFLVKFAMEFFSVFEIELVDNLKSHGCVQARNEDIGFIEYNTIEEVLCIAFFNKSRTTLYFTKKQIQAFSHFQNKEK